MTATDYLIAANRAHLAGFNEMARALIELWKRENERVQLLGKANT